MTDKASAIEGHLTTVGNLAELLEALDETPGRSAYTRGCLSWKEAA